MQIDIITVLPELLESPLSHSIMKRAQEKGIVSIRIIPLRPYGIGKTQQLDDYPYGGGGGMVMKPEPLARCIEALKAEKTYDEIIFVTPDGEKYTQGIANQLSLHTNLLIIAGHYKGIDDRIRQTYITREISIGDYVLSGGELPAAVLVDSIVRVLPGAISDEMSALTDSFQDGLLSPPVYTRPEEWNGIKVPEVLLSGHEEKIREWRMEQALKRTQKRRPDLLE